MKSFRKNARAVFIVILSLFLVLVVYFVFALNTYGSRWLNSPYNSRLEEMKSSVIPGDIKDRNGVVLATADEEGNRVYIQDTAMRRATAHVVGDSYGLTGTGAESFFANYLLGMDTDIFSLIGQTFSSEKTQGSDVVLTIDAELCKYAASVLGDYDGSIVVMNYKTGEILALVNSPTFDPETADEYLDEDHEDDSALVNRATAGQYTPGSVFKIITAAAAIRYLPDAMEMEIECGGPMAFDKETREYLSDVYTSPAEDAENKKSTEELDCLYLRDYQSSYHDTLTLKEAFAVSCNVSFAKITLLLGGDKVEKMAKAFGIGVDHVFPDIAMYSSSYEKGDNEYDTAWSGVGQYKDIMTPLNLCLISASIANDGAMMEPKLMRRVVNSGNYITQALDPSVYSTPLTEEEAQLMQELMIGVVETGTGKRAAISGYTVGGKTGTAQTGRSEDHAWFTGFVLDDDHPFAVAVIVEEGGSGGTVAAPMAQKVLEKAIELS